MKIVDINSVPRKEVQEGEAQANSKFASPMQLRRYRIIAACVITCTICMLALRYYLDQKENKKWQDDMFQAVYHFEAGAFDKALDGDGIHKGLLEMLKECPDAKTANLARFYVGVAYMHQKEYAQAITMLKRFSARDFLLQARAWCVIGDAYSEQQMYKKAAAYYMKAAGEQANSIYTPTYLRKAAIVYEVDGQLEKAQRCYQSLIDKYPQSEYGQDLAIKEMSRLSVLRP